MNICPTLQTKAHARQISRLPSEASDVLAAATNWMDSAWRKSCCSIGKPVEGHNCGPACTANQKSKRAHSVPQTTMCFFLAFVFRGSWLWASAQKTTPRLLPSGKLTQPLCHANLGAVEDTAEERSVRAEQQPDTRTCHWKS